MRLGKKFFRETGYFLQEIARSKIILQAILVGLISGLLVVLFKVCINKLFALIQNYISQFDLIHKLFIFPIINKNSRNQSAKCCYNQIGRASCRERV